MLTKPDLYPSFSALCEINPKTIEGGVKNYGKYYM